MADWSVKIAVVGGKTVFQTQLQPGNTSTLYMSPGDSVSWNNTTSQTLQPTLPNLDSTQGSQFYLSDPIAPDQSSRPSWIAPKNPFPATYAYTLASDSSVKGTIIVNPSS